MSNLHRHSDYYVYQSHTGELEPTLVYKGRDLKAAIHAHVYKRDYCDHSVLLAMRLGFINTVGEWHRR